MDNSKSEMVEEATKEPLVNTGTAEAASDPAVQNPQGAKDATPEREPTFKDYVRVFSYANRWDIVLMIAAAIASVGAGITMPLMNIIFGKLVGSFNDYAGPNAQAQMQQDFDDTLNQQSLYMLALFVARFGLNYINKVRRSQKGTPRVPQVYSRPDY